MLLILFVIIHLLFNQFHLLLIFYRLFHLFDLALCFFLEGVLLVVLVEPHYLIMRVVLCLHILIIFELHDLPIPDIGAQMRSPQGPD